MSARKSPPQNRRGPKPSVEKADVFLNIPYDERFEKLLFAYIAGISAFGFVPRATLEIPLSQRRLERIISPGGSPFFYDGAVAWIGIQKIEIRIALQERQS